jgi:Mn2+/Fe2+ NRAMP family transporter
MSSILEMALGVMAAAGGFVDIGDIVFASQAGSHFGFGLLWALALGVVGVILYSEFVGRVAAVAQKPIFQLVRERYHPALGWTTLIASLGVNLMTCAAEVGGVAIVLRLLLGFRYGLLIAIAAGSIIVVAYLMSFELIENVFGWLGLMLTVFVVAALTSGVDWRELGTGLVVPGHNQGSQQLLYAYFAVGTISTTLMPYEIIFYSSGAMEQKWGPKDVKLDAWTSGVGYTLGSLLVVGIVAVSAKLYLPSGIVPQTLSTTALAPLLVLGRAGLLIALGGMLFTIGGAAIETSFSAAYSLAQFMRWDWGKVAGLRAKPRFASTWIAAIVLGALVVAMGVDPVQLTEYSVIFSVVLMPLTYFPIMRTIGDRKIMGEHANGPVRQAIGWAYYGLICLVAVAAIPLMIATKMGSG